MSMDYTVRQVYNDVISRVTQTEADWKAICKLTGQIYRYEFDNILMVYAQRPGATLIADYDTWKKVRRYVKRGSKGIAIFPSRALKPNLRYVFDISDTGGRNVKLTWDLEGDNLSDYLSVLQKRGEIPETGKADRESQLNVLKAFTKREISGIIKEDFGERFAEAVMLTGREITGKENETPEPIAEKLVFNSIFYAVGTRCGFDLSSEELDLGAIVNVRDESCISVLGTLVSDVSCTVLRNMNREIMNVERERRMEAMAVSYHEKADGLLYPNIRAEGPERAITLGKFGIMAKEYLESNYPQRYKSLSRFGNLYPKLKEVEEEADRMMETLMEKYLNRHKPENPESTMEMFRIRKQGMMEAEEIVLSEIVNQFH